MVSQLEARARELDSKNLKPTASAIRIANELGISKRTAKIWVFAKRNGHTSFSKYIKDRARKLDELALKKGFLNHREYSEYLDNEKENETAQQYIERKYEEEFFQNGLLRLTDNGELEEHPSEESEEHLSLLDYKDIIQDKLKYLDKREREIICQRFLTESPKTLEELGKVFAIRRERVRQLEARALRKLENKIPNPFKN